MLHTRTYLGPSGINDCISSFNSMSGWSDGLIKSKKILRRLLCPIVEITGHCLIGKIFPITYVNGLGHFGAPISSAAAMVAGSLFESL
jgi:hypothetical protein